MIVVMQPGATPEQVEAAIEALGRFGFDVHRSSGTEQVVLGALGVQPGFDVRPVEALEGVAEVHRVTQDYRLASRLYRAEPTVFRAAEALVGGPEVQVVVAPGRGLAATEAVRLARSHGAALVFGGHRRLRPGEAFAPLAGHVAALRAAGAAGLAVEVLDETELDAASAADLLVVGPDRMAHVPLLRALGTAERPVLLYRSPSATVEEWLTAADHVLSGGNAHVALCESGLRTFEPTTHRTLDLSAIPAVKARSHLPVFVDPSYGTGVPRKVAAMSRAAVAAGADGLVLELYATQPSDAVPFADLMAQVRAVAQAVGRR